MCFTRYIFNELNKKWEQGKTDNAIVAVDHALIHMNAGRYAVKVYVR